MNSLGQRTTVGTIALLISLTTACGTPATDDDPANAGVTPGTTSVTNCGEQVTYATPVTRLFVNDGNMISIALAAGARPNMVAVSSLERDRDVLALKYGEQLDGLNVVNAKYPTLENIVASQPQVVFAGWNYGFSEGRNLTPDVLKQSGIDSYLLTESCRQPGGKSRGVVDPWEALRTDLKNIGTLTGHSDTAAATVSDVDRRLEALRQAPKPAKKPVVFLFDSASSEILSSGSFGAPQGIMDAAGADSATSDVKDTWTRVSWERLAAAQPDAIFFVDYPPQTYQQKLDTLAANPASRELTAVKEKRYVNLPYALWTSGPLNIDAAEITRAALEHFELLPASGTKPALDLTRLTDLPGNEWLKLEGTASPQTSP